MLVKKPKASMVMSIMVNNHIQSVPKSKYTLDKVKERLMFFSNCFVNKIFLHT